MDDLLERLRTEKARNGGQGAYAWNSRELCGKAADRIEALQAEVARLRERLRAALPSVVWQSTVSADSDVRAITKRRANQIRAALKGTDNAE